MLAPEVQVRKDSRLFAEMCATLLRLGHRVQFRAEGQSMTPNLRHGDTVQVAPVNPSQLRRGDVALVENEDGLHVHRVNKMSVGNATCITRSDTGLHSDPAPSQIFGKVVAYSTGDRQKALGSWRLRVAHPIASFTRRISLAANRRLQNLFRIQTAILFTFVLAGFSASSAYAQADLAMTQSAAPATVSPGNNITYTEKITNNGPNLAATAVLYQSTPPNTTFVNINPPGGWNCVTPGAGNSGAVTCTDSSSFANGSPVTFTFIVKVAAATPGGTNIVNSANVTSATQDLVPQNNATTTTVLVEQTTDADLSVSMSASPSPVFISTTLTYTIRVQNIGLHNAAATSLTDTIPAGTTFISATTTAGSCTQVAAVVCTLGTLTVGGTDTITITVTSPGTASTLTNTAAATTTTPEPGTSNNSATAITVVQPISCASPGHDGTGTTITGVVNTYYAPSGAATINAGGNSVTLGPATGATTPIAINDLLLIIQMQDATINSTNSGAYGDGIPGDPATGVFSLNSSGKYEFVTATRPVPLAGGLLTFSGAGSGNGALNTYTSAVFGTNGQKTFQVIRVPQYSSATLGAALTAPAWNGTLGGVLAIDVASQLNMNSNTIDVSGLGFRGGAGRILGGAAGTLATDYLTLATAAANGSKGEGIAGTPRYIANFAQTGLTDTTVEGYPNGSYARGAPGNAGGGATDANPTANDENSGGGGGGNGGIGGYGGYGWSSAGVVGGHYGSAFPFSTNLLAMGGAGGAGTTNDGTSDPANANPAGINSSGAAGGGIVIIRAGSVTGTGTIKANGQSALNVQNDGGGGGGAGGSVLVFSNTGVLTGLTINAIGGNGGNTWSANPPGTFPGNRHGPGGGGGGGAIILSSAAAGTTVTGGINGFSTSAQDAFGATPGQPGTVINTNSTITQTPGTQAGAYCGTTDLSVTNSGAPAVVAVGANITYTQSVINNSASDALNAVFTEAVPANTTFQSITIPTGWTCSTPAVNGTGNITCSNPDVAGATTSNFAVVVKVKAGVTSGTQIVSVDNVTSGTSDPNLANNSATAINTVSNATSADLVATNTASSPTVTAGTNFTMTGVVTNQGPASATNATFIEAIPANSTFVSLVPPAGWGCATPPVGSGGTISCFASGPVVAGAVATFPVVLAVPALTPSGTVISATVTVGSLTPDSNSTNNTATATTVVATAGQVDLAVTSAATPNPVTQGNNITYTQFVTNNGPTAETNATFTDTIPTNTTLFSFTPPANWTCNVIATGGTGTFTCTLNGGQTIAVGASVSFPLVVKVVPATPSGTIITNTVNVTSTVADPNSANNAASAATIVAGPSQSDVSITKTASPEPVNQGTNLTYTLTVTNGGPAIAQGVNVSDPLPAQVTEVSASSTQGNCSLAGTTVSCTIGNMTVGSVAVITINVTANTFSSASLSTNTATVSVTLPSVDPNLANNTSSSITTIQSPTAVDIASFRAISQADGSVLLEWRTHEESRNLGFHIYRDQGGSRQRVTPSLVAGSALLLRGSQPQHAAKLYRWIDPLHAPGAVYWIEDVDINGTRTLHGPASLEAISAERERSSPVAARAQASPLLRELRANVASIAPASRRIIRHPIYPVFPTGFPRHSVADHDAVKIAVNQEGWYHVSLSDLQAAGLASVADPRSLHLFAEGIEQPLLLVNGGNNNASASAIEFYGTGIDTPFSAERVYWLVSENQSGKRIVPAASASSGAAGPTSFPFSVVREDRTTYFAALLNGENNDNFFGATVTSDPVDQQLTTAHLDSSSTAPATLDLALQGATDQQEHRITVQVNGATVGLMDFQGMTFARESFSVDSSLLHEGDNTVTLTALNGDNDVSVVQSIQLNYAHTYTADSDWLRATVPPGAEMRIAGFTNPQIRLFDISDPLNITQLNGKVSMDAGLYAVNFVSPGFSRSPRTVLAFAADAVSAPVSLAHHAPSHLDDQRAGADVVIITHPDFSDDLDPLVSFRQSQGHHVLLVTTDQLYDEYNYGEPSPLALRSFLNDAATRWQQKPQSVLLVGDASFDPRNYLGLGSFDFVPTRMIDTAAFKTASDDWFTDFRSTGYATIPTGRLPVRTSADAQLLVSKIVGYEQGTYSGSWNGQALVVADQNVNANFSSAAASAVANLPASLQVSQILADGQDATAVRTQLLAALNNGSLFVNYQGHGAEQQWSFVDLFNSDDATALTNGGRLPVYLLMDCLNGLFQDVYAESLAESVLLAPNGGGVAVWASSGFTEQAPQSSMNQAFIAQFAAHPGDSIGSLILRAKSGTTDDDVRKTWILFGDPAMKIHLLPSASAPANASVKPAKPDISGRPKFVCARGSLCSERKLQ